MRTTSVLSAAALCLVSACADQIPVEPTTAALRAVAVGPASTFTDQVSIVDPSIADLRAQLGLEEGDFVVASVELLYDMYAVQDPPPTLILANDRVRLTPPQWVPNDPRRGGRADLNWGYLAFNPIGAGMRDASTGSVRAATPQELEARIVEGMAAWQSQSCRRTPLTRVMPGAAAPDIIQVGWVPKQIFPLFNNPGVLGVTITSWYVNNLVEKIPTDIDGNGRPDIARAEIVYNAHRIWSDNGPVGTIDFFSVIAHESGHAFGLNHFGKVFVAKKNVQYVNGVPQVSLEDIQYAPKALMNAIYITGRSEIAGTDHATFCGLWGEE